MGGPRSEKRLTLKKEEDCGVKNEIEAFTSLFL